MWHPGHPFCWMTRHEVATSHYDRPSAKDETQTSRLDDYSKQNESAQPRTLGRTILVPVNRQSFQTP